MGVSLTQLLIILVVILILFGAGKLPKVMGDLGKGLKNFREGTKEEDKDKDEQIK
jgi:sec-independent protein translocase protein TatA